MPNFSDVITAADRAAMNAELRALTPSAAQRSEIARQLGVTERTTARWFTGAAQQRDMIPRSVVGKTWGELQGTPQGNRLGIGADLRGSAVQGAATASERPPTGLKEAQYDMRFSSLGDASRYIDGLKSGQVDEFLRDAQYRVSIERGADGVYRVIVDYVRDPDGWGT